MSLQKAKSMTQRVEREIVDGIPPELIVGKEQKERGSLLSCSDGRHHWAGHFQVTFTAGVDGTDVVEQMARRWPERDGYRARAEKTPMGAPRFTLTGPGQSIYMMDFSLRGDLARLSSFSPCVEVKPGEVRGPFY